MPTRPHLLADIQQCKVLLSLLHEKLQRLERELLEEETDNTNARTPQPIQHSGYNDEPTTSASRNGGDTDAHAMASIQYGPASNSPAPHTIQHTATSGFGETHRHLLHPELGENSGPSIPALPSTTEAALMGLLRQREEGFRQRKVMQGGAHILLHLYHHPGKRASNNVLGAAAGYSASGASKHMTKLLHHGLVVRRGWQVFLLTEKALEYIREAAGY